MRTPLRLAGVQVRRLRRGLARVLVVLAILDFVLPVFLGPPPEWLSIVLPFAFVGLCFAAAIVASVGRTRTVDLELSPGGIASPVAVPASAIREGWIEIEKTPRVVLRLRGRDLLQIWGPSLADLRATLDELGHGVAQRRLRVRLAPARSWVVGTATAILALCPIGVGSSLLLGLPEDAGVPVTFALLALVVTFTVRVFGSATLSIGTDGVLVERRLGSRFVSWSAIRLWTTQGGLALHLVDGRRIAFSSAFADASRIEAIVERMSEAKAAATGDAPATLLAALARDGRPLPAWRAALVALGRGDGDAYRSAVVRPDDLAAVIRDPRASLELRLAAAIALAATSDSDARSALGTAAEASADERTRRALEAARDGKLDDDRLEQILRDS